MLYGNSVLYKQAGYFTTEEYGLIEIAGQDCFPFLQSQLSNDVYKLEPGRGQLSCLLDKKAHVQAYFHLFRSEIPTNQSFYILCEKEQIASIITHIEQYRFAADVKYTDLSEQSRFICIEGPRANKLLCHLPIHNLLERLAGLDTSSIECGGMQLRLFRHSVASGHGFVMQMSPNTYLEAQKLVENLAYQIGFAGLTEQDVFTARIENGSPKYGVDFDADNLLSETGLSEKTVSYTKGCFIGQEVLARIKSHGSPARAIMGLVIENNDGQELTGMLPLNAPIVFQGEQIGYLKSNSFSTLLNKHIGLALLKRDFRIPEKKIVAEVGGHKRTITVTLLPFFKCMDLKQLANDLYEHAVQIFVQSSEMDKPIEAIKLLQEVLLLDPSYEDAYEALAVILSKYDELEEAVILMKKLTQLNPDSIMAHSNLSLFYMQKGLIKEAEEEKALSLSIRMKLAAAQVDSNKKKVSKEENEETERRMEMFSQVLAIDDKDFFANAGMGECLVNLEKYEQSILYLERTLESKPLHLPSYFHLAKAYEKTNLLLQAKDLIGKGITIAAQKGDLTTLEQLQTQLERISSSKSSNVDLKI